MKKGTLILIVLIAIIGVGFLFYNEAKAPSDDQNMPTTTGQVSATTFDECVTAGGQIQESNPRRCAIGGVSFTEDLGNVPDKSNLITVTDLAPNQKIKSPLTVHGKARGTWFFEASFPVRVADADGNILGSGVAEANGDWMTEDFVPFTVKVTFTKPATKEGSVTFLKDNPSGLPENEDALVVPVQF